MVVVVVVAAANTPLERVSNFWCVRVSEERSEAVVEC
jgi:hypothetical protein